jgi:hypothetical protein
LIDRPPLLFKRGLLPFATGVARYLDVDPWDRIPVQDARILVRVGLESGEGSIVAVMDTAAPWCIFKPQVGLSLRRSFVPVLERAALSTRLGVFQGSLYRIPLRIEADEGETLSVEGTVFLSPDWDGPNFLGYQGLLQRIRFAIDPETNLFYFGQI